MRGCLAACAKVFGGVIATCAKVFVGVIALFFFLSMMGNRGKESVRPEPVSRQHLTPAQSQAASKAFRAELATINATTLIDSLGVTGATATITVNNAWHGQPYQNRLQAAQGLWERWARIADTEEQDFSRIKIVDLRGNEVGGSRILGGSLIWVQEN